MIYISLSKFLTFIKFRCENLGSTNSQMNFQVKEYSDQNLNSPLQFILIQVLVNFKGQIFDFVFSTPKIAKISICNIFKNTIL